MTRFDLDTDRDTWRSEQDRADIYDRPAEYDDLPPVEHVCDDTCRETCAMWHDAIWQGINRRRDGRRAS